MNEDNFGHRGRGVKQDSSIYVSFWIDLVINSKTITEDEATNQVVA